MTVESDPVAGSFGGGMISSDRVKIGKSSSMIPPESTSLSAVVSALQSCGGDCASARSWMNHSTPAESTCIETALVPGPKSSS